MPTVLIAPDSFKTAIDAPAAARAIARGIRDASPNAQTIEAPMADGGEGTLEIILDAANGLRRRVSTTGPLGEPLDVTVGLIRHATTAVIELATVAGYTLVPPEKRNPLRTTTFGLGQVIRAAIETDIEEIILTLGGSATVDGGAGMMQALGMACLNDDGRVITTPIVGGDLMRIRKIIWDKPPENLHNVQFTIACDVLNPACGPGGAAAVFAPQKGADTQGVKSLERGLENWTALLEHAGGRPLRDEPGTGAAGGVALPLLALASAHIVPGADFVSETIALAQKMQSADLVITGEGRLDRQSMMGKTVGAVARMARTLGVPSVAIVGAAGDGADECLAVLDSYETLDGPIRETESRLEAVANRIAKNWF